MIKGLMTKKLFSVKSKKIKGEVVIDRIRQLSLHKYNTHVSGMGEYINFA